MTQFYRVLRSVHARTPFDGEGAFRYGGRWSSVRTRLSYASEHQSLAMLEYFIHLDKDDPPADLVLAVAEVPDGISRERVEISDLPANWRHSPPPAALAARGDEFARKAQTCILLLPSALAPREYNCLINPLHPEFGKIVIRAVEPLAFEARMFRTRRTRGPR